FHQAYGEARRTEGLRSSQGEPSFFTCIDNAVTVPRVDAGDGHVIQDLPVLRRRSSVYTKHTNDLDLK
ncbi:hypothetical protein, partial [uncultured Fretibacterium sp.]|uniref:hypothetical protein n=1 Tax=uncultured Fretibacterium sp. TaxID=1678694 RepID=UPI0026105DBF